MDDVNKKEDRSKFLLGSKEAKILVIIAIDHAAKKIKLCCTAVTHVGWFWEDLDFEALKLISFCFLLTQQYDAPSYQLYTWME